MTKAIVNFIQSKNFSSLFHCSLLIIWLFIYRKHPAEIEYSGDIFTKRTLLVITGIILLVIQIIVNKPITFKVFYFGIIVIMLFSFYEMINFVIENKGLKLFESKYLTQRFIDLFKPIIIVLILFYIYSILVKK